MAGCIALFIDAASFADFADREAALAFARGAIARGVRVVALHDPTLEARLRIAAAAAAPTPSVETGAPESVAPLIFVRTGEPGLGDEAVDSDREQDDLVEWRGRGADWQRALAEVLEGQPVRLVVGFGSHERTLIARRAAEGLDDSVRFYWTGAIERGSRPVLTLGEGERSSVVADLPIDLEDRGLDAEARVRVTNDLRAAVRKVLHVQEILTDVFGPIERRSDRFERQ